MSNYIHAMPNLNKALSDVEFRTVKSETTKLDIYKGKIILLFFGYTNCPDICPTTLLDMSRTLKELGKDSDKVQAVFISVDPKRGLKRPFAPVSYTHLTLPTNREV